MSSCLNKFSISLTSLSLAFISNVASADTGSRLITSGGITGAEGAAGGGITPWAFIAGYGSREEIQGTANLQQLHTGAYTLKTAGIAVGIYDQWEISLQHQKLDVSSSITSSVFSLLTSGAITSAPGTTIEQTIVGLKYHLWGDAIFATSHWQPGVAIGMQYKKNHDLNTSLFTSDGTVPLPDTGVPLILGATEDSGIDIYLTATKYLLGKAFGNNLLLSGTARATKANTLGLLGFESQADDNYKLEWEASVAIVPSPELAIGVEMRTQSNRLGGLAEEETIHDIFVAWFPDKSLSVTAAWVDLGNLPLEENADGFYLSITGNF